VFSLSPPKAEGGREGANSGVVSDSFTLATSSNLITSQSARLQGHTGDRTLLEEWGDKIQTTMESLNVFL
jgi:hypothetical protein